MLTRSRSRSASSSPEKAAASPAMIYDILDEDAGGGSSAASSPAKASSPTRGQASPAKRDGRARGRADHAAPQPAKAEPRWVALRRSPVGPHETAARMLRLPHPRTGRPARYLLQDDGRTLLEATEIDGAQRSWFIGDHVYEDGRLLVLSPIHPVLLLLPLLERARRKRDGDSGDGVFVQLDEILSDELGPGLASLRHLALLTELDLVCDVKRMHGMVLYRLNDDRATRWLQDRVVAVAQALRGRRTLDASQAADVDGTARQLVSEYLNDTWAARLTGPTSAPPAKTVDAPRVAAGPVEDYGRPGSSSAPKPADKKSRPSPAQKALSAVDTSSMKKMSAFFTKKT